MFKFFPFRNKTTKRLKWTSLGQSGIKIVFTLTGSGHAQFIFLLGEKSGLTASYEIAYILELTGFLGYFQGQTHILTY